MSTLDDGDNGGDNNKVRIVGMALILLLFEGCFVSCCGTAIDAIIVVFVMFLQYQSLCYVGTRDIHWVGNVVLLYMATYQNMREICCFLRRIFSNSTLIAFLLLLNLQLTIFTIPSNIFSSTRLFD